MAFAKLMEVKIMDIGKNITDSLGYPIQDWVKIIILTVISIRPIVNFISGGFYLRIIKSTLAGLEEIPEFDELGELFIDGIKLLIVGIIYLIVPLIFFAIGAIFLAGGSIFTGGISAIFFIIGIIIAILISIIGLMGIVNMAYYDSDIGAALRFSEIIERIETIGWGNYITYIIVLWIVLFVLGAIIGLISSILAVILIGFVLYFIGSAYLLMFQARSVALIFAESEQLPSESQEPKDQSEIE
jgi:hypothetical protein